ncbi:SDR family NAD(P)-dependent oxidoreductase [uncultured Friedmanniella sp.]|uniref:SDR family NAD(P)-dependent oxidoreductase n=1 Tax=uncultured Friedmanniella sp. TaxID=335381 RepID=UPI0035C954EF
MTVPEASGAGRLTGRVAVVTGGTNGIGVATARALRFEGADVLVLGRSADKVERLLAEERDRTGPGRLQALAADFSQMAEVVAAVGWIAARVDRVDLLLHSVGVLLTRPEYTAEGLERDFAVSYLSRFLFLEEAGRRGLLHPGTRMVNVAASAPRVPRIARVEFGSLAEVEARIGLRAHGQAQLAADLLTAAAPERYGITAVGYGPGAVDTGIRREVPAWARAVLRPLYAKTTRRPEQAAADVVAAFLDPDLPTASATFRNRRGVFDASAYVTDRRRQQELITVSRALIDRARG